MANGHWGRGPADLTLWCVELSLAEYRLAVWSPMLAGRVHFRESAQDCAEHQSPHLVPKGAIQTATTIRA